MSLFFCAADSSCFVAISCQKESKNTATNHSLYMDESKNIIFCFVLIIVTSSGGRNTDNKSNIPFGKKKSSWSLKFNAKGCNLDPFSNQETTFQHKFT